jgi:hypothetical protein
MPQANDPSGLSQGNELIVSDAVWGTPTANQVTITSAGTNLPVMDDNEFIEIRNHSDSVNNGLYQVNDAGGTTTAAAILDKVSGSNPIAAAAESINIFSALDTALTDMLFDNAVAATATVANRIDINSALVALPAFAVGERFEVENHSDADNNGAYEVITINTISADYTVTKLLGVAGGNSNEPNNAVAEAADVVTERKTVMWDTAALRWYVIEQGGIDATGASGQAVYSKAMIDWLDDSFLRANAPFPMRCIDKDAGKYLFGQDANGNNSGWLPTDDADIALGTFGIRSRKLLRNAGWNEIDANGIVTARSFGALTVDAVENALTDTAFGYFGSDTTVDDTFDLTFPGPVNEAVEFYKEQPQPGSLAITTTTITRTGGSFVTEGYKVGGQFTARLSEDAGNDGDWLLTGVSTLVLTVAGGLTANVADTTMVLAVNNSNAFRLGMRERDAADTYGSTFAQADLNSINKPELGNFVFQFPLATGSDLKITTTDANMTVSPYDLMTLDMAATPQARGGSGVLVGGPYNFGFIMEGNGGTKEQCFEWLQWQLRKLTDVDLTGSNIGRTIGLLARFVGDQLEVGSADGGLTQTLSPDGGGAGLYIDNLNSADANLVTFYDSLGQPRLKPTAVAITLDANSTLNDDTVSDGTLFFKNTIENAVDATFVINAGTGADGTFASTAQFPASLNRGVGAYVEVVGLTGANEPMNGIYQVTALTSTSLWSVTRYDGKTIVTTTGEAASIDENPINCPDSIIVHTNVSASGTDISFTANDTIGQTGIDGVFAVGDFVEVEGSTSGLNDGIWEVTATPVNALTVVNETGLLITTQGAGPSVTITKIVQAPLSPSDFNFSFDYSNNEQGGRTGGTNAKVQAKALGRQTAQYTESTVQTISTAALIIPLVAQGELNVTV